jgi:hypothetical protein
MILQGSRLPQQTSERMRRSRSATDAINLSCLAEEALESCRANKRLHRLR